MGRELASCFLLVQLLAYAGFMYLLTNGLWAKKSGPFPASKWLLEAFQWPFRSLFRCRGVAYSFRSDLRWLPTLVEGLAAVPLVFLFALSMRLFSHGAGLTEKCRTIPAFVNQIPREEGIDLERQYLVDFITRLADMEGLVKLQRGVRRWRDTRVRRSS